MASGPPPPSRGRSVVGRGRQTVVTEMPCRPGRGSEGLFVSEVPRRPGRSAEELCVTEMPRRIGHGGEESSVGRNSDMSSGQSDIPQEVLFFRGGNRERRDRVAINYGHIDESMITIDQGTYYPHSERQVRFPPELRQPRLPEQERVVDKSMVTIDQGTYYPHSERQVRFPSELRQPRLPEQERVAKFQESSTRTDDRPSTSGGRTNVAAYPRPTVSGCRKPKVMIESQSDGDHEDSDIIYQDFDGDGNLISKKHGLLPGQVVVYRIYSKPPGKIFKMRQSDELPYKWMPVVTAESEFEFRILQQIVKTFDRMNRVDDFPNHRAVEIEEATKRAFHSVPASPPRGASTTVILDREFKRKPEDDPRNVILKLQREADYNYKEVSCFTRRSGKQDYDQQPGLQQQQQSMGGLSRVQSTMSIISSSAFPSQPSQTQVGYAPDEYMQLPSYGIPEGEGALRTQFQLRDNQGQGPEEEPAGAADAAQGRKWPSTSFTLPSSGSVPRRPLQQQTIQQAPAGPQQPPNETVMSDRGSFPTQPGQSQVPNQSVMQTTANQMVRPSGLLGPAIPLVQPSMQPLGQPSLQPSGLAPVCPLVQPSMQPLGQPSLQTRGLAPVGPLVQSSMQPLGLPSIHPTSLPYLRPPVRPNMQAFVQQNMESAGLPSMPPTHSSAYFGGHQAFYKYLGGSEDLTELVPVVPVENRFDEVPLEAPFEAQPETASSWSVLSPDAKEFYPKGYVAPNEVLDPEADVNYSLEHLTHQFLHTEIDEPYSDSTYLDNNLTYGTTASDPPLPDYESNEWNDNEMWDMILLVQQELVSNPGIFNSLMEDLTPLFKKWLRNTKSTQNVVDFVFDVAINTQAFIYLGAKMCVYMTNLTRSSFQKNMIKKCKSFFDNIINLFDQDKHSEICGFVLFLAELYVQSKNDNDKRLIEFAMPLLGCLEQLLKHPQPKYLEAFVKALKLAGIYLDEDMNPETNKLIKNANKLATGLGDMAEVSALKAVIKTRENNWGRSNDNQDENTKGDERTANPQDSQLDEVYYSPDGQVMTAEERFFLETQGAPSSSNQDGKQDEDNDSMDEEMQEAFEQFLLMVPDAR